MHLKRLYKALAIVITVAMILPQTWVSTFAEGEVETVEAIETEVPAPPTLAPEAPTLAPMPTDLPPEAPTETPTETPPGPSIEPTPEETPGAVTPEPELTPEPEISEPPMPSGPPIETLAPSIKPTEKPNLTPNLSPSQTPTDKPANTPGELNTPGNNASGGYGSNFALVAAQQIVMPPITVDKYRFVTIEKVYAVAEENLIIREAQDVESREIGKIEKGGLCFIIKDISNSEWAYVESGKVRGFVKTEYLTMGEEAIAVVNDKAEGNMVLAVSSISPADNKALTYIRETVYETRIEKAYAIAKDKIQILDDTTEGTIGDTAESTIEDTTEDTTEVATEDATEDTTEVATEDTAESATEGTAEDTTESATEGTVEETTESTVEDTAVETTESTVEETAKSATEESATEETTKATTAPRAIGELPKDGICYILEAKGEWLFVEAEDVRGFVKADQLITGAEAEAQLSEGSDWAQEQAAELATQEANLSQMKSDQATAELEKKQAEAMIAAASEDTDEATIQEIEDKIAELEADINKSETAIEEQLISISEVNAAKSGMFGQSVAAAPKVIQLVAPEDNKAFYYTFVSAKDTSVASSIGNAMIEFASQFLGNPYVWGGTSLTNGADCSGFVQGIYSQFGYNLPRTSGEQSQVGMQIPVSEARTGDLIFYARNGVIYHVVMYIDNGQVIHASSSSTGIITSGIDTEHAVWATRMISDDDTDKVAAVNAKAGPMMYGGAYTNATEADKGELLGNFKLTAYCNCVICCGKWAGGPTASGTAPVEGRTVAMAGVPFGTKLVIGDKIYTVEDRGTPYGHVDIYMENHDQCNQFGVQYTDVYAAK